MQICFWHDSTAEWIGLPTENTRVLADFPRSDRSFHGILPLRTWENKGQFAVPGFHSGAASGFVTEN